MKKGFFSNAPIFNEEEAKHKLIMERIAIMKMADEGIHSKAILNYWSDTSGECHAFPIFTTDTAADICNRYSDLYPIELEQMIKDVSDTNENLYNSDGMSKYRTKMLKLKVPIIMYRALQYLDPDFWENRKNMNWVMEYLPKLKVGTNV